MPAVEARNRQMPCKGIGKEPLKVTKEGDPGKPRKKGRRGPRKGVVHPRGICPVCRTERAVKAEHNVRGQGGMRYHLDPGIRDIVYSVEIEQDHYGKIVALSDHLGIRPEVWLDVVLKTALDKAISEL